MKNRNFAIIICIILLLGSACTKDNNDLFNEFGLNKDQLSNITTISAHKAIAIDCSFEQFMKIRQELKNNGFYEWNEFHGILGVDESFGVSQDFLNNPLSGIVALDLTFVLQENMAKIMIWYDNEWGYSHRILEMACFISK